MEKCDFYLRIINRSNFVHFNSWAQDIKLLCHASIFNSIMTGYFSLLNERQKGKPHNEIAFG